MLTRIPAAIVATMAAALYIVSLAYAQTPSAEPKPKEPTVTMHAAGTFEVKVAPQTPGDIETAAAFGRYTIDKEIHGDLEATSKGVMLTTGLEPKGSGAYVALERVTGKLNGREGSFVLQHYGTMTSTSQQLLIAVVPNSGTGQLAGLSGKFQIKIADKKHFYEFDYMLPAEK